MKVNLVKYIITIFLIILIPINASAISCSKCDSLGDSEKITHCQKTCSITETDVGTANCDDIFGGKFGKYLTNAIRIMRYAVPLLLIGLSIADFFKALASQDDSQIKKAISTFKTRAIIGLLIFFVPTLINLILKMSGLSETYDICILDI